MNKLNKRKALKAYLKFLAYQPASGPKAKQIQRQLLKGAPDSVIKAISNAALNARRGDVQIGAGSKKLFRHNLLTFKILTNPTVPIARKRRHLASQRGGFAFIPALLGTLISSLGGVVIDKLLNRGK